MKDYRITSEEAAKLDDWHVVNKVIFRVDADAPDTFSSKAIEKFFAEVPHVPAAAYAAWFTAGSAAGGGMWMIFEVYCAPFIEKAIDGYLLFGEDYPADCLRRACQVFPKGKIPSTPSKAEAYLNGRLNWDKVPYIEFERDKPIRDFFDCSKILREHRSEFIREPADP